MVIVPHGWMRSKDGCPRTEFLLEASSGGQTSARVSVFSLICIIIINNTGQHKNAFWVFSTNSENLGVLSSEQ